MIQTIYITRNGLLEPLGQSQVMAYLRGLSKDYDITLITYEKKKDWYNKKAMLRAQKECADFGITWKPQLFWSKPKIIAPAISMIHMIWILRIEAFRKNIRLIHSRSYIPAVVSLVVSRMTKIPFIFDMRALWPEELITAGRLHRGSLLHRAIVKLERACLAESAGVISLTKAAIDYLKSSYPEELNNQKLVVIPTCADLKRFTPLLDKPSGPIVHGCIGTLLSGWFLTDWLAKWMRVVILRNPSAFFKIITLDDIVKVKEMLDPSNELHGRFTIVSHSTEQMPEVIRNLDVSVMFFSSGLSKLGSSPTRLAEVLGSGLPVVVNDNVGDIADIVKKNNVGVIVEGPNTYQMEKALNQLLILLNDSELITRCRNTAKKLFSLEVGTEAYRKIYKSIINIKE